MRPAKILACLALALATDISFAADPPKDGEAARLVKQLGSKSFAEREAAAKKLTALGTKAKPAVVAGTTDADAEVARRCEVLVKQIRDAEREAFIAGTADWPGPAGRRFREVLGESKEGRKLLGEALAEGSRAAVLEGAGRSADEDARLYQAESKRVEAASEKVLARFRGLAGGDELNEAMRLASRREVPPGDVVRLLLLGVLGGRPSRRTRGDTRSSGRRASSTWRGAHSKGRSAGSSSPGWAARPTRRTWPPAWRPPSTCPARKRPRPHARP